MSYYFGRFRPDADLSRAWRAKNVRTLQCPPASMLGYVALLPLIPLILSPRTAPRFFGLLLPGRPASGQRLRSQVLFCSLQHGSSIDFVLIVSAALRGQAERQTCSRSCPKRGLPTSLLLFDCHRSPGLYLFMCRPGVCFCGHTTHSTVSFARGKFSDRGASVTGAENNSRASRSCGGTPLGPRSAAVLPGAEVPRLQAACGARMLNN